MERPLPHAPGASPAQRYVVEHETRYAYTAPVSQSWQLARLTPRNLPWQRLLAHSLQIDPPVDERHDGPDSFGNSNLHFALHRAHRMLRVHMQCTVEVAHRPTLPDRASQSWEEVRDAVLNDPRLDDLHAALMCEPTRLLPLSVRARDYAARSLTRGRDWLEALTALTQSIHLDFEFEPGATTASTSVEEVLAQRHGVCQDFAHLMLCGLRSLGLPARYVSGYLLTDPPPGQARLMGVDATHAWVAAYAPGVGWVEFDPTNNLLPSSRHITVAFGRDYFDVAPIKGIIFSSGKQNIVVKVDVNKVEE